MFETDFRRPLSLRLDIRRMEAIKQGTESIGVRTKVKVVKNKLAPPFREAEFEMIYGEGVSKAGTILDAGVEQAIQVALDRRLDAREARLRVADAERSADLARWNQLPPMNLDVRYTKRGFNGTILEPYERSWNGWRVGLTTTYTLDRPTQSATTARAEVSIETARRAVADAERAVAADVRAAHRAWQRAEGTIALHDQAVTIAEKQLRLAELRFERGLDSNVEVIDAETSLLQAQSALTASRIDRALTRLVLARAMGAIDPAELAR